MYNILIVGMGGFIGASLRYVIYKVSEKLLGNLYPYGTLTVNVLGCFLIGIMMSSINVSDNYKLFLITGILGGLTTFSAFAYETTNMFTSDKITMAFINIFLNLTLCFIGVIVGRYLMLGSIK
ncbi:MAG TPA: fluoride efflux transporter CrcB [Clostridiales bacterium]|nr:MAG: hypothetical protein A2Y18_03180 [Clostridiales bacterium GWD2_32_19]HCC07208.1 fluoride efflux transporter CrcB [Clostridiales bacterium]